jgi:hypothetical protein
VGLPDDVPMANSLRFGMLARMWVTDRGHIFCTNLRKSNFSGV